MATFWQLTSCIRRRSGMVCFAVPKVAIDLMRPNGILTTWSALVVRSCC